MSMFDAAKEKAQQFAADNPDKVEQVSDQAIQQGGDRVDTATGGKYAEHVDKGQQAADDRIGDAGGDPAAP